MQTDTFDGTASCRSAFGEWYYCAVRRLRHGPLGRFSGLRSRYDVGGAGEAKEHLTLGA